jgi:hypothetical protein
MDKNSIKPQDEGSPMGLRASRRNFLMYSGFAVAATAVAMTGCKKDEDDPVITNDGETVNLGSGDVGILNYAYALEQLEAAFYTKVVADFYVGATSEEKAILNDIQKHEVAHADFFKAAIGSAAIKPLTVDFSSIDFTSRASVLGTAKAFEDLGVSAYNGAGQLLTNPIYLGLAGKIVSIEARHASVIRDLLNPGSADFSGDDVIDAKGLDVTRTPSEVLAIAGKYIKQKIDAGNLPK